MKAFQSRCTGGRCARIADNDDWTRTIVDRHPRAAIFEPGLPPVRLQRDDVSQYDWIVYRTLPGQRLTPSKWGDLNVKRYSDSNLAVMKNFRITERVNLRFRGQARNLFNHFNYLRGRFNTNAFDENFGTSFPALTRRREISRLVRV